MAMLAGVDLLGKFQSGEDESASVGKRFKDFIKQNAMNLGDQDCETLYHLRNALLHSFGLYSKSKHREYHFLLTCKPDQPLITELPEPKCQVDLQALNGTFRAMTARYRERLEQDGTLQKNFNDMFAKYGQISILPAPTDDNVLGGYNTSSF
jgi:hypothetical protein